MAMKYSTHTFRTLEEAEEYITRNTGIPGYSEVYHSAPAPARSTRGKDIWTVESKEYAG